MRAHRVPGKREVWVYQYEDEKGSAVAVGSRVRMDEWFGVVVSISDPDGDVDDEGRSIGIPPRATVRFDAGDEDSFLGYWTAKGWWDEDAPYCFDDFDVLPGKEG